MKKIHDPWLEGVTQKLGRGETGRAFLAEEMERFFKLLVQAVESGDPGWLKPVLIDWAASRTETDIEEEKITLSPVLNQIMEEMIESARNHLSSEEAIELITGLVPILYYAYEQIAQHEMRVRVGYFTARLEKVSNDLSQLDRSKSDFISVAAHELKTPLTLIEGYSSMLGDIVSNPTGGQDVSVLLTGIHTGIQRLGEMINDMIDISMIDNNMLALNFQPTWINRLLRGLSEELRPVLTERRLELIIHDFDGADQMFFADPERLEQAFRNLLTNAIKYTPDHGRITVDGRRLSGFLEVIVEDTGIGIAQEDQMRIFEKFSSLGDVSLHSSSKVQFKGGGPGLGLPITRGILEAHGGSLWVESDGYDEEELPGSVFHVLLPIRKEAPDDQMARLFKSGTSDDKINE
ncbi:MAG: HAMP domain-containing sensor histidine kinase [Anaerolineales bacterium]